MGHQIIRLVVHTGCQLARVNGRRRRGGVKDARMTKRVSRSESSRRQMTIPAVSVICHLPFSLKRGGVLSVVITSTFPCL